jgi:hypothetical protein
MEREVNNASCKGIAFGRLFKNLAETDRLRCRTALLSFNLSQTRRRY